MEEKTCHGCGLESADDCEQGEHVPAIDSLDPYRSYIRNPRNKDHWNPQMKNYWHEAWTLDENGQPFIKE